MVDASFGQWMLVGIRNHGHIEVGMHERLFRYSNEQRDTVRRGGVRQEQRRSCQMHPLSVCFGSHYVRHGARAQSEGNRCRASAWIPWSGWRRGECGRCAGAERCGAGECGATGCAGATDASRGGKGRHAGGGCGRFHDLTRRWMVERTFVWPGRYRALCEEPEQVPQTNAVMVAVAMIQVMHNRLISQ
jgi:hypothetical protein